MDKKRLLPCGRPMAPQRKAPTAYKLIEWENELKSYLASKQMKFTEQRWLIAKLILKTGGHLDAQGIVAKVKEECPSIGAATVYRSIKVLCDANLLELSHQDERGRTLYELPDDAHHDHIICNDCGEILEFHNDEIEGLQEKIASHFNFKLTGHRHVIQGECEYLAKKKGVV